MFNFYPGLPHMDIGGVSWGKWSWHWWTTQRALFFDCATNEGCIPGGERGQYGFHSQCPICESKHVTSPCQVCLLVWDQYIHFPIYLFIFYLLFIIGSKVLLPWTVDCYVACTGGIRLPHTQQFSVWVPLRQGTLRHQDKVWGCPRSWDSDYTSRGISFVFVRVCEYNRGFIQVFLVFGFVNACVFICVMCRSFL